MQRTYIDLDISALQHNFRRVQQLAPDSKILAMVKANAYGHGAEKIAKSLLNANAFGVSSINEAIQLRNANVKQDIVLMQGFYSAEDLSVISSLNLHVVLHDWLQLTLLEQQNISTPLVIWIKIDTGMHRLGFDPQALPEIINRLEKIGCIKKPYGYMTHFASSEQLHNPFTQNQFQEFLKVTDKLPGIKSLANSAAILGWPNTHADWVRPGLMLYGVSPFSEKIGSDYDLKPVMNWSTSLMVIHQFKKGDGIGYNSTFICPEDMPVGVVAAGYGDGYPRQAKNGTPVLVNNKRVPIIGRVSMDMLTVDLRGQPEAKIGDPVLFWGNGLPIEEIARLLDISPYQLLCGVRQR